MKIKWKCPECGTRHAWGVNESTGSTFIGNGKIIMKCDECEKHVPMRAKTLKLTKDKRK